MNVGDRLICVFPNTLAVDTSFSTWPFHITIVPWFRLTLSTERILHLLSEDLTDSVSFTVQLGESDVKFGHQKGKLATLVQLPTPLISIEKRVRDYLHDQHAWIVDESTMQKRAYRPHVTNQRSESMHTGVQFIVDCLYTIEQMGSNKRVTGKIPLGV